MMSTETKWTWGKPAPEECHKCKAMAYGVWAYADGIGEGTYVEHGCAECGYWEKHHMFGRTTVGTRKPESIPHG